MPCTEGRWLPVIRSAVFTTLRALQSAVEQLPYQAVMQPERTLSMVHLYKFVSVFADMPNFLSLLRKYRRFWAVLTAESACMDQVRSSLMYTPRNLKLETLSTTAPSMCMGSGRAHVCI